MADGMISTVALDALAAPFPDSAISWRVGSTNIDKKTGQPRGEKKPYATQSRYRSLGLQQARCRAGYFWRSFSETAHAGHAEKTAGSER